MPQYHRKMALTDPDLQTKLAQILEDEREQVRGVERRRIARWLLARGKITPELSDFIESGAHAWPENEEPVTPYAVPQPDTALCRFCGLGISLRPAKVNPKFNVWLHLATDEIDCSTDKQE